MRGTRLYELACERDLEGIVAKWAKGSYQCDGRGTSWLKIKNPLYSQGEGDTNSSSATAILAIFLVRAAFHQYSA